MKHVCLATILLFFAVVCKAQNNDLLPELKLFNKVYAKFALDEEPKIVADTNLIAIWNMQEDADKHNYFVLERRNYYTYAFTYMNRGGSNRTYENVGAFFSKIGDADFLNVSYYDDDTKTRGYFFLKVTGIDSREWNMTMSLVADTTLRYITSRETLRDRIAKNVNNPGFYKKPVYFHKKLPLMFCK